MRSKSLLHYFVVVTTVRGALANFIPALQPGFLFQYSQSGQSNLHIPVTSQCEQIHLEWKRDKNSTGPAPVAPYFLQVYSSASSTPYVVAAGLGPTFAWDVPFAPSTQYQICMLDSNGVSGGCEQIHSVITNSTSSTPSCQNVTSPNPMWVSATVPTGALPKYGYIDQCKTMSFRANDAVAPYTLTISPSGHAPFNVTSKSPDISWPVSLSEGTRFFASLQSSDGQSWSNGPIRVGGQGTDDCLSPNSIKRSDFTVYIVGSTIGATCFGLLAGLAAYYFFMRLRRPRRRAPSQKYYSHPYLAQDDPFKALRTPGTSVIGTTAPSLAHTAVPRSPTTASDATALMTPHSHSSELPLLTPSTEPLRPLRPNSAQHTYLSGQSTRSRLHQSVTPFTIAPSESSSSTSAYPLDVKRPFQPDDSMSTTTRDDSTARDDSVSLTSTTQLQRALSARSRAPTYVADPPPHSIPPSLPASPNPRLVRSSQRVHTVAPSEEFPPQYGNHVADHSLNYDPNILSSGTRL
ncbi:hypothetical protein CPB83DRAFT_860361 [Crepidotus variabilis]|uniref:Uncharacterized protein n=1 Tax=Crepidotus variabilis TaxID=179855 RepID=A0A9P6E9R9_9AGAR|nr:hypothetical protein CPB83DRAFT_860361 [Crepidotus variabilis]